MLTVHIGPPKTATSSLQEVLQGATSQDIAYIGIQQPRIDFVSIIENPHKYPAESVYLKCAFPSLNISSTALVSNIKDHLSAFKVGFLSEEMFMIDHPRGLRWQTKIIRLRHLLKDLSPIPLITLRHPLYATQSLYRELFTSLPRALQIIPGLFALSNSSRVYDYKCVLLTLKRAGFSRARIIDFERLCDGKISERSLHGIGSNKTIVIPHRNKSSTDKLKSERSRFLAQPLCRWILSPRVKYYYYLKDLLAQQSDSEICIETLFGYQ